ILSETGAFPDIVSETAPLTPDVNDGSLSAISPPASVGRASLPAAYSFDWLAYWPTLMVSAWAFGAVVWLLLAGIRIARFQRLLGHAQPATSELQALANRLA